jgi:hypothetical protein
MLQVAAMLATPASKVSGPQRSANILSAAKIKYLTDARGIQTRLTSHGERSAVPQCACSGKLPRFTVGFSGSLHIIRSNLPKVEDNR